MADNGELEFKVEKEPGEWVKPKWRKVKVENAECPKPECGQTMIVILGHRGVIYAYCQRCDQYYVGE